MDNCLGVRIETLHAKAGEAQTRHSLVTDIATSHPSLDRAATRLLYTHLGQDYKKNALLTNSSHKKHIETQNSRQLKIFNMSETQHTSLPVRSTQGTQTQPDLAPINQSRTCTKTPKANQKKEPDPSKTDTQGAKHAAAASPRATTTSWTPNFERRQSWSAQDRKHELQMAAVDDVRTGPGFTERSS